MGNRISGPEHNEDQANSPWFHIIQWASASLPSGAVMRYDIGAAQESAHALCQSENSLRDLVLKEDVSKFSLPSFAEDPEMDCLDSNVFVNPSVFELAEVLLAQLPNLARVRYDLVPGSLSEDVFWRKFFSLLRRRIIETIVS
jgi:hypothetical protein